MTAVDDLAFIQPWCGVSPVAATPPNTGPTTAGPNITPSPIPAGSPNCTFETDKCLWYDDPNSGNFHWTRYIFVIFKIKFTIKLGWI